MDEVLASLPAGSVSPSASRGEGELASMERLGASVCVWVVQSDLS